MRDEYDFSKAQRGKFYDKDAELHLPVYLDAQIQIELATMAQAKGMELSALVNDLLKKDIELIHIAR
ncbi:MAG: hypothetical protein ACOY41_04240 [Pseudomonadota bacterium]